MAGAPGSKTWKAAVNAHLRSAPSGRSPVVAYIPRNAPLTSTHPCTTQWCAVDYNGKRGWIYKTYIVEAAAKAAKAARASVPPAQSVSKASLQLPPPASIVPNAAAEEEAGASFSLIGLNASDSLPVREGPFDTAPIAGTLSSSASEIEDLKTCVRQWCLIEHDGVKGYVQSRFLARAAKTPAPRYSIDGQASVKVFNFGGAGADIVGEIPFYASGIVPIGDCNADWCHIRYLGLVGFVDTHSLRPDAEPEG